MHNKKHFSPAKLGKKSGFTLIEMLIVIVIIGILASALIPRLTSARGRANDVARKADLQQIATALISYQIDHGSFPSTAGGVIQELGGTTGYLAQGGMSSVPRDPANAQLSGGMGNVSTSGGDFGYIPIKKNGQTNGGIVLMATIETSSSANYVWCGVADDITGGTDFDTVQAKVCISLDFDSSQQCHSGPTCKANPANGSLRYIYVY